MSYTKTVNNKIECLLCPNNCTIADGKSGICRVRTNRNGVLALPCYGKLSALAADPIEKKPLYHYYPGKTILSAGFYGCSLKCPFCQNYNISQRINPDVSETSPEELVQAALDQQSFAIAYTYSEPLIHFEYIMKTAKLAREKGLKNILVSNGYLNKDPARELLEYIDAANIDLKSFNPDFYRDELGGKLDPVQDFIKIAAEKTSLEITTLIIPGKNDSDTEIDSISGFIGSLNPEIPLHLSCYYPTYKYSIPSTLPEKVFALKKVAEKHLQFVYAGNVGLSETNTICPECNNLLIKRRGYNTEICGITGGKCSNCGYSVPIEGV